MLTDAALKFLKPKKKPYKVADRDGIYVVVSPAHWDFGSRLDRLSTALNRRQMRPRHPGIGRSLTRAEIRSAWCKIV